MAATDFRAVATTEGDRYLHVIESVHVLPTERPDHLLNKLRLGDIDWFSLVLLTQFLITKSKSTLIPGPKLKLSPKPLHSLLKSESSTSQIINMYFTTDPLKFRWQVTHRNRQQRFSTWFARQQRKHFQRTGHGENPNMQRNKHQLSKGSAELLVPAKWCIDETTDCLSQSRHIFGSQIQPTLEIRRWVNVQCIAPFLRAGSGSPLKKAAFKSPLSRRYLPLTARCKTADSPSDVTVGDEVGRVARRGPGNPSTHSRAFGTFSVPPFFHVSTQRARWMWLRGTLMRSFTRCSASLSNREAHSSCFCCSEGISSFTGRVSQWHFHTPLQRSGTISIL